MKNKKHILLFFFFQLCLIGFAQDVLMQTQSVMKQEFINPAFNSFKGFTSVNLMTRYQWYNQLSGAPVTYAANVYIPVGLSGLGMSFMAINQSIGLRQKTSFSGSFSHNLSVTQTNYLALGYSVGLQNVSFDTKRLQTYPDLNMGGLELSATDLSVSFGLFYYNPAFFVGLSSNVLITSPKYEYGWLIPGFDFTAGYMYHLSTSVFFRPDMVLKYYPLKQVVYENGEISESMVDPVLDVGVNFLLSERLWLGTSHRFGQAQTFSVDVIVREAFKFGYIYELGIGKGLNQFNSQGIRLVWNLIPKSTLKGFARSGRHNINGSMSTYLYR